MVLLPGFGIAVASYNHARTEAARLAEDEEAVPVPLTLFGVSPLSLYTTTVMFAGTILYPVVTSEAVSMLFCIEV